MTTEPIPLAACDRTPSEPWERRVSETSKAYEAFCAYRDMGAQRSQLAVCAELGRSRTLVGKWASDHRWVARTAAWDSIPVRAAAEALAEAYAEMARDIAQQHMALANALMRILDRNLDLLKEGEDPSIRWSTAYTSARQGHAFAMDLSKPAAPARDEINRQIAALAERLTEGMS